MELVEIVFVQAILLLTLLFTNLPTRLFVLLGRNFSDEGTKAFLRRSASHAETVHRTDFGITLSSISEFRPLVLPIEFL